MIANVLNIWFYLKKFIMQQLEFNCINSKLKTVIFLLLLSLLISGCTNQQNNYRTIDNDIGLKLLKTAVVLSEDVLPHLAKSEATSFAAQAKRHWSKLERHIGHQVALSLAKHLRELRKEKIAKAEFEYLEQEAKIELMEEKPSLEREIAEEKFIFYRKRIFQKSEEILVTSAIDFLEEFANGLAE